MSVLLLQLVGPMQSWGVQSRFSVRDTGREPSKSGVVGLLCAALGRPRSEPIRDLAALKMGVRVDDEGRLAKDYQTALNVAKAGGGAPKECEPSSRYYLADAKFLVGLEGDERILQSLDAALRSPKWPLSLGRKSFLPSEPISLPPDETSIRNGSLLDVLCAASSLCRNRPETDCRLVLEVNYGEGHPVMDQPVSFETRQFEIRHTKTSIIQLTAKG